MSQLKRHKSESMILVSLVRLIGYFELIAQFLLIIVNLPTTDRLLYIYTSGTEGLPKAAIIKHSRFVYMGAGSHYLLALRADDILYTSLPLYHMAGGTVGVCQAVIFGNTMVIRNKFSASNFFKDCVKYKCTVRLIDSRDYLLLSTNQLITDTRLHSTSEKYADTCWRNPSHPTIRRTAFEFSLAMDCDRISGESLSIGLTFPRLVSCTALQKAMPA